MRKTTHSDPWAAYVRAVIEESGLTIGEFAEWVMNRSRKTVHNWLRGDRMPLAAKQFLQRLESVEREGDTLVIRVRRGAIGPRSIYPKKRRTGARKARR